MIFSSVWLVSVRLASVKLVSVENLSESSFLSSVVVSGSIEEDFGSTVFSLSESSSNSFTIASTIVS